MTSPLSIVLVDDSELASVGLRALLRPFAERVEVMDLRQAMHRPDDLDVVLFEPVHQSDISRSIVRDLQRGAGVRSAVFSWAHPGELPAPSTSTHLSKSLSGSALVAGLEDLVSGRPRVAATAPSPRLRPEAHEPRRVVIEQPTEVALTPREVDVLTRIVRGLTNQEIGVDLMLSINSVKSYVRSAYRKIEVERRTQAVLWGLDHGLGEKRSEVLVG